MKWKGRVTWSVDHRETLGLDGDSEDVQSFVQRDEEGDDDYADIDFQLVPIDKWKAVMVFSSAQPESHLIHWVSRE